MKPFLLMFLSWPILFSILFANPLFEESDSWGTTEDFCFDDDDDEDCETWEYLLGDWGYDTLEETFSDGEISCLMSKNDLTKEISEEPNLALVTLKESLIAAQENSAEKPISKITSCTLFERMVKNCISSKQAPIPNAFFSTSKGESTAKARPRESFA